jgi:hypothetical protein
VRRVEDVDDERAFDRLRLHAKIEIAERDGVRRRGTRQRERRGEDDNRTQQTRSAQNVSLALRVLRASRRSSSHGREW